MKRVSKYIVLCSKFTKRSSLLLLEVDYKEFKAIVADQVKATPCRDWSNLTIVSLVDRIYYFMNVQAAKAQLKKHCSRFWSEVEEGNDSATKILSRAKHLLGLVNLVVESHAVTQIIQRNIIKVCPFHKI